MSPAQAMLPLEELWPCGCVWVGGCIASSDHSPRFTTPTCPLFAVRSAFCASTVRPPVPCTAATCNAHVIEHCQRCSVGAATDAPAKAICAMAARDAQHSHYPCSIHPRDGLTPRRSQRLDTHGTYHSTAPLWPFHHAPRISCLRLSDFIALIPSAPAPQHPSAISSPLLLCHQPPLLPSDYSTSRVSFSLCNTNIRSADRPAARTAP